MKDPIGLLALQGDFDRHREALERLGERSVLVRRPAELERCRGLIMPGGESTTMARLLDRAGLREPLRRFAGERPVMATCAGLILLAQRLAGEGEADHGVRGLGLLDCTVRRNAYGRQIDSFSEDVSIEPLTGSSAPFRAVFIRAPRIEASGPQVEVVARRGDEPVAVRQGKLLCLTFHPELTEDGRVHAAFLALADR